MRRLLRVKLPNGVVFEHRYHQADFDATMNLVRTFAAELKRLAPDIDVAERDLATDGRSTSEDGT
jgi:hypothetical protein